MKVEKVWRSRSAMTKYLTVKIEGPEDMAMAILDAVDKKVKEFETSMEEMG